MTERELNEHKTRAIRKDLETLRMERNYFPIDYNAGTEDREFDRKHEVTGAGEREMEYCRLADFDHNSIPMSDFCRDYIYDNDERFYGLVREVLRRQFSNYRLTHEELGKMLESIVLEGFNDHTAGMD